MSIKIRKQTGEVFDLPTDYIIEATRTNPLFTPKGSQTVPVHFPTTDTNKRLTDNAQRIDNAGVPKKRMQIVVESGAVHQNGLITIQGASETSISGNIGFDEAELYASMTKTMLPDLPNLPFRPAEGTTIDEKRDNVLSHLRQVMNEEIETDYAIFQVILKKEKAGDPEKIYLEMLNNTFISRVEEFNDTNASGGVIGGFRAKENRVLQRIFDSSVVPFDVPKAYGISPFLRVWKLIELIFNNYNFSLENNPFKEHDQLKKLVVLNNTMDAVITGSIYYKDMMPDITVETFLDALHHKFGLQYFVNSTTRSVRLEFMRDIFDPSVRDETDLTKFKTASPSITYKENKCLKLVGNNELDGTEPKVDSYEDFLRSFNYTFKDLSHNDAFNQSTLYYLSWFRQYASFRPDLKKTETISSDFFNWDKKEKELTAEEITFTDLNLPIHYEIETIPETHLNTILLYLVGYKHNYSDVSVSGKEVKNNNDQAKLALAFFWGKTNIISDSASYEYNYAFASQDNRDCNGNFLTDSAGKKYDLSLYIQHEDGLFNRFWKNYDAWLRHSGHEVNASLKLSEVEIYRIKPYQKIIIDHQLYLMEEMRYQMDRPKKPVELKLRTVRLYEPYDLATEQKIETYTDPKYYWRADPVKTPNTEEYLASIGIVPTYEGVRYFAEDGRSALIIYPPTEEQYLNQETFQMIYQYRILWHQNGIDQDATITEDVTYYPELIS